jgi:hypothetical protein
MNHQATATAGTRPTRKSSWSKNSLLLLRVDYLEYLHASVEFEPDRSDNCFTLNKLVSSSVPIDQEFFLSSTC